METIIQKDMYFDLLKRLLRRRSVILWVALTLTALIYAFISNVRIISSFSSYMPTVGLCFLVFIFLILAIPENREKEIGTPGLTMKMLSFILLIAVLGIIIGYLTDSFYLSNLTIFGFMFIFPLLILHYRYKINKTRLGLTTGSSANHSWTIIIGILYGVLVWFLIGMNELFEAILYFPSSWYYHIGPAILLAAVILFCAVALPEEFLFRGVLQPAMIDRLGRVNGILVSSLIFGMFHVPANYMLYIYFTPFWTEALAASILIAFLLQTQIGLVLGIAYERTKSLLMPITIHAVHDIIEMFPYFIYLVMGSFIWI